MALRFLEDQVKLILGAVSFLTILPTGQSQRVPDQSIGRIAAYFPIGGLLIGAGGAGVGLLAEPAFGPRAASALIIIFFTVVTGALHLDGLADTFDGLAGGRGTDMRLKIMGDGSSGPAGIAAVTLALILKYSLLAMLVGPELIGAVVAVPALARWPLAALIRWVAPAKKQGMGAAFAAGVGPAQLLTATAIGVAVASGAAVFLGPAKLIIIPVLGVVVLTAAGAARRFFGGLTGDLLGAAVEITEICLFAAVALF